ncbi:MAG: hypothetical protein WC120_06060 [Parcubacteria group bacterium]
MEILDNFKQAVNGFWQDKYKRKRTIIIAVFAAIFLLFVFLVYHWTRPVETCADGIKNQNETDIDCGGVCPNKCEKIVAESLVSQESGFVESGAVNRYDLYSRVSNPNNVFGSSNFQYEFRLKDAEGNVIATKQGIGYILPGESKYVVENNIETDKVPSGVEFAITGQSWVEFTNYFERPQLKVVNKQYNPISSGVGFSEATGLLKNESPYDFTLITLEIILKDINDKVIALNSTEMRTVKSGENRDFRSLWLNRFPGEVMDVEVQAEVDIFDEESFIKKNFESGSLQQTDYR